MDPSVSVARSSGRTGVPPCGAEAPETFATAGASEGVVSLAAQEATEREVHPEMQNSAAEPVKKRTAVVERMCGNSYQVAPAVQLIRKPLTRSIFRFILNIRRTAFESIECCRVEVGEFEMRDVVETLKEHGISPSAQRVAVASFVLSTTAHPSADEVWKKVRAGFPMISRATVYNTLNLFAERGLVKSYVLAEGSVVFDPNVERHHHFIDDETGAIYDVPWDAVQVGDVEHLKGYGVREYQVVMRGRRTSSVSKRS